MSKPIPKRDFDMKRIFLIMLSICCLCTGCTRSDGDLKNEIDKKLAYYSSYSKKRLQKDFERANVAYPPKQLALLVFKNDKRLQLYAKDRRQWQFIKTLPVKAVSGGPGPKLYRGDHQVPEGIYQITELNPRSHYLLSMKLNYPNEFDRTAAGMTHRNTDLGDNIFIHGKALSNGCIAIGDDGIEQLFPLVSMVGAQHVEVVIAPDDLRYERPIYGKVHPRWLPTLYDKIRSALSSFPLRSQA